MSIFVCVFVYKCVCGRESERETEKEKEIDRYVGECERKVGRERERK